MSGAQFNFRLASSGGAQAGNACFWFDVRSGGTVIGTHGSYASPSGCSTGTTLTTFSTALPEVTSTDRANGLVIRAYVWETGTKIKTVNVDLATLTGSTPYAAFTAYEIQAVDDTSGTPATAPWPLATVDATDLHATTNWPSATPATTKYLKLTLEPSVPTGSVITAVSLTNVWHASAPSRTAAPSATTSRPSTVRPRSPRTAAAPRPSRARTAGRPSRATRSPCRR